MSEHPTHLLPHIADGLPASPEVASHLDRCAHCRAALGTLAPLDLDDVWHGVVAELDAPRVTLGERLATRLGLDPSLARLAGTTPSMSAAWLLATTLVLGLGMGLASVTPGLSSAPALAVAPVVAAAAVAFAYGPGVDPAYELVAVTPVSPVRALLVRLAAVLTFDALLVGVIGLAVGADRFGLAWLLPMTAAALLAAVVASRFPAVVGAAVGMAAWLLVLGALNTVTRQPLAALASAGGQLSMAAAVVVLLGVLLHRAAVGDWVSPRAAA